VRPEGPAEKAGLEQGDVIVALDDVAIDDSGDLPPLIAASRPGSERVMTVLRDGRITKLKIRVGELGRDSSAGKQAAPPTRVERLGLRVTDLEAATREVLDLAGGVRVEEVGPGPAATAGLLAGDILLRLGRQPVENAARLLEAAAALPSGVPVPLLVKRQDSNTFVTLTLPKAD
jgi:serine protease Do